VSIQSPVQDRRLASRVTANLHCKFSFKGLVHEAYVTNLSLNGALLSSPFRPPERSNIVITLKSTLLKNPLTMPSEVVLTDFVLENGMDEFAVRFSHTSLDLIELIKHLFSQPFRVDSNDSPDMKRTLPRPAALEIA
jgi:hypothetical protein